MAAGGAGLARALDSVLHEQRWERQGRLDARQRFDQVFAPDVVGQRLVSVLRHAALLARSTASV